MLEEVSIEFLELLRPIVLLFREVVDRTPTFPGLFNCKDSAALVSTPTVSRLVGQGELLSLSFPLEEAMGDTPSAPLIFANMCLGNVAPSSSFTVSNGDGGSCVDSRRKAGEVKEDALSRSFSRVV
jgi:hypothetical protein